MAITWSRRNASHLMRRAAFGASPSELDRVVAIGLEAAVEELLDPTLPDPELDGRLASFDLQRPPELIQWWLTRMIYSRRQLQERMTLFLHDHFATSIIKVGDARLMHQQNELFRTHAFGNFAELTIEVSKDPAMLIWLDNFTNLAQHPNENYARELLELFTLGHHLYTEDDVIAAARAFTGWSLQRRTRQFQFYPTFHDYGSKTFLGVTGNLDGADIVRIACAQHEHARFLAEKLFRYFVHDDPTPEMIDSLASVYESSGLELTPLLRAILTSDEMYAEHSVRALTASPLDHAVIAARILEIDIDATRALLDALSRQNHLPFLPPDVNGWTTGLDWINSNTLLARMNLGRWYGVVAPVSDSGSSAEATVDHYLGMFDLADLDLTIRAELVAFCNAHGDDARVMRSGLVQMIVSLPESQFA